MEFSGFATAGGGKKLKVSKKALLLVKDAFSKYQDGTLGAADKPIGGSLDRGNSPSTREFSQSISPNIAKRPRVQAAPSSPIITEQDLPGSQIEHSALSTPHSPAIPEKGTLHTPERIEHREPRKKKKRSGNLKEFYEMVDRYNSNLIKISGVGPYQYHLFETQIPVFTLGDPVPAKKNREIPRLTFRQCKEYRFPAKELDKESFFEMAKPATNDISFIVEFGVGFAEVRDRLWYDATVSKNLAKEHWVMMQYWITLWKMTRVLSLSPTLYPFTPVTLLKKIKRKYHIEFELGRRPCLRRALERDDSLTAQIILEVTDIISPDVIEVTDGWVVITAVLDPELSDVVRQRKIAPGMKLRVFNAKIIGTTEAFSPAEGIPNGVSLSFNFNSVRRARDDAVLGFAKAKVFTVSINSLRYGGGVAPCIDVVVIKKYPVVYSRYLADERREEIVPEARELKRQDRINRMKEKKIEEIREQVRDEYHKKVKSGGRITDKLANRLREEITSRFEKWMESLDPQEVAPARQVFTIRVVDSIYAYNGEPAEEVLIKVYGESDIDTRIRVGRRYRMFMVSMPRRMPNFPRTELLGSKFFFFREKKHSPQTARLFKPAVLRPFPEITIRNTEVDIIGYVVWLQTFGGENPKQELILVDKSDTIAKVELTYEEMFVSEGGIVMLANLVFIGGSDNEIHLVSSEYTVRRKNIPEDIWREYKSYFDGDVGRRKVEADREFWEQVSIRERI